ncbi:MAG: methyltransferase family protein [Candidatus Brocadiia bacterium]
MAESEPKGERRGLAKRLGSWALRALGLFVILEPIWMLLPFAGFLYGSVLHIQALNRDPRTAWLTHFVCPVLTGGLLGPVLVVVGFMLFCAGAAQIYTAKLRKSGLVTAGLYRFVRHPQYISLTLFGLGILLTWGRAVTFLAFFLMMFLYYYLAKSEERTCLRLFGEAYQRYRQRTSFIFPGDRRLRPLRAKLGPPRLPAPLRVGGAFLLGLAACLALMWGIDAAKRSLRTVPWRIAQVPLGPPDPLATALEVEAGEAGGIPFLRSGRLVVARGPWRAARSKAFAARVLLGVQRSAALDDFLAFLEQPEGHVAVVFCGRYEPAETPGRPGMRAGGGPGGRGPAPEPWGPNRLRLIFMRCRLEPGAGPVDALADRSRRRVVGGCIAKVDLGKGAEAEIVEGEVTIPGPGFPAERLWGRFVELFASRGANEEGEGGGDVPVPGRAETARLVLVQAPILRTRLDPGFADEIRDRLAASPAFRRQLRQRGAGGQVVAAAFPRPGPNWYREHHGKPQISVFVMLARLREGGAVDALFEPGGRRLLSAFTAELDLAVEPPADPVGAIATIGPWRDLEERWRFFLSGVGGGGLHVHRH